MTLSTTVVDIDSSDVEELISLVWGAVLDTEITPSAPLEDTAGFLAAGVELIGDWPGAFTVACEVALADRLAMALFGIERVDVADADRRDALGELTNMSGGNLKALLPGSSHLGLPEVAIGSPGLVLDDAARSWTFSAEGLHFVVRISNPTSV